MFEYYVPPLTRSVVPRPQVPKWRKRFGSRQTGYATDRLRASPATRQTGYATATVSASVTSAAARSPERMAPSIHPHMTAELSVPAQWIRPQGARNV